MAHPTWDNVKEKATESVQSAAQTAKSSIPGLSTFECNKCGTPCEAGYAYDPDTGAFYEGRAGERPAWICKNDDCGMKFRRERDDSGILVLDQ
jgi:hypothetical protein